MNMTKYLIVLLFVAISVGNSYADSSKSYYDDRERGWYWYEEPPKEEVIEESKEAPALSSVPLTPEEIIQKQREAFDSALANAIVNPTPENVREYLAISQQINDQAAKFTDSFKKTIWVNPEYDYSVTGRPTNTQAIAAHNQHEKATNYSKLHEISQDKGIIYFFSSTCHFCERFSPILKQFAAQFNFTIIPVSLDNQGTKSFPNPRRNNYMAKRLNVSHIPAVFLVDPDENTVSTVGYGYADWTTLVSKMLFANNQMEISRKGGETVLGDIR